MLEFLRAVMMGFALIAGIHLAYHIGRFVLFGSELKSRKRQQAISKENDISWYLK